MSESVEVAAFPPCDICAKQGRYELAAYDAKTRMGPWANLCQVHYEAFGVGLGTGRGQRLIKV